MRRTVHLLNIQHFREKLAEASGDTERGLIERLLAEEERKLLAAVREQNLTIKAGTEHLVD